MALLSAKLSDVHKHFFCYTVHQGVSLSERIAKSVLLVLESKSNMYLFWNLFHKIGKSCYKWTMLELYSVKKYNFIFPHYQCKNNVNTPLYEMIYDIHSVVQLI